MMILFHLTITKFKIDYIAIAIIVNRYIFS